MLQYDPTHRLSLEEVKSHPWFTQTAPDNEMVKKEFTRRKVKVDNEAKI